MRSSFLILDAGRCVENLNLIEWALRICLGQLDDVNVHHVLLSGNYAGECFEHELHHRCPRRLVHALSRMVLPPSIWWRALV
jgi:hypothetical protein